MSTNLYTTVLDLEPVRYATASKRLASLIALLIKSTQRSTSVKDTSRSCSKRGYNS